LNLDQFLGGTLLTGALIGFVAAFWSKLKSLAWKLASLVVVRFTVENETAGAVAQYLWRNSQRSRFGERAYDGAGLFVRPKDRRMLVAWEKIGNDPSVYWIGWRPVVVSFVMQTSGGVHFGQKLTLTCIRGVFNPDDLVARAARDWNDRKHGGTEKRFSIQRFVGESARKPRNEGHSDPSKSVPMEAGGSSPAASDDGGRRVLEWKESELGPPSPPDPLGPLAFPPSVDELVREARQWLESEAWYKDRRIAWRTGWLLYGPPGTGKTSLGKAVAIAADLKLFIFELATMDDQELIYYWQRAQGNTPCMVLIEDIDAIFDGRTNLNPKSSLSYSCFLNCLSGAEGADGIFLVITTNNLKAIDPALGIPDDAGRSTRPGRVDRVIELRELSDDCRARIARRILADCPHEIVAAVKAGDGDTGAQFQDRCAKVALAWHWANKKGDA
jgi:hypothetical protein